MFLNLKSLGF